MSYCLEYAKSNRSTCKTCKTKIDKDSVRVGTIVPGPGDYDMTSWRHLACQKRLTCLAGPSELDGFDTLKPADKDLVFAWFEGDVATVQAAKRKADEATAEAAAAAATTPKKKAKSSSSAASPSSTPATKAIPGASSTPLKNSSSMPVAEEMAARDEAAAVFNTLTIPNLKNCLRANLQLLGGTKPELVERCVDRKLYGNLPKCPQCGIGRLKVSYPRALGHGETESTRREQNTPRREECLEAGHRSCAPRGTALCPALP